MKIKQGFTLIELLIVIALIGVLAVALVATLNPIEQVNRARDTRYKADASELLSAIERYFAATMEYPWVNLSDLNNDDAFGANCQHEHVGVCANGICDNPGLLITSGELKDSFARKNQFIRDPATDPHEVLYVIKPEDSTATYVCFIPQSGVNRQNEPVVNIYDGSDFIDETPQACTEAPAEWNKLAADSCFMCVPDIGARLGAEETED